MNVGNDKRASLPLVVWHNRRTAMWRLGRLTTPRRKVRVFCIFLPSLTTPMTCYLTLINRMTECSLVHIINMAKRKRDAAVRWTSETEERFVEQWQQYPCLFDVSSREYHDQLKKRPRNGSTSVFSFFPFSFPNTRLPASHTALL